MYCSHFGLHRMPFNNTPDPAFYFSTPEHEEALASLKYAVLQRKGFVLVTGEIGAGKTLIGRLFLRELDEEATVAVVTNTNLNGRQLLFALCAEFALEVPRDASNLELTQHLQDYLLEQFARDRYVVVLVDEGQNLPDESFEELRMLGNLEADDAKLLQVCILGQPELRERFARPSLRQLDQRIFSRFHLKPLNRAQTDEYIAHRLNVAGLTDEAELFTDGALDRIYTESQGVPRIINQICDNSMLTAYGKDLEAIDEEVISRVLEREPELRTPVQSTIRHTAAALVGAGAVGSGSAKAALHTGVDPTATDRRIREIYGTAPEMTEQFSDSGQGRLPADPGSTPPMSPSSNSGAEEFAKFQREVAEAASRWVDIKDRFAVEQRRIHRDIKRITAACRATQARLDTVSPDMDPADASELRETYASRIKGILKQIQECAPKLNGLLDKSQEDWTQTRERLLAVDASAVTADFTREARTRLDTVIQATATRIDDLRDQMAELIQESETLCDETDQKILAIQHEKTRGHQDAINNISRNVAQHENQLSQLGEMIRQQLTSTRGKLDELNHAKLEEADLKRLRDHYATGLQSIMKRVDESTTAIQAFKDDLRKQAEHVPQEVKSKFEDVVQQVQMQSQQLQAVRQKLVSEHAETLERIAALSEQFASRGEVEQMRRTQQRQHDDLAERMDKNAEELKAQFARRADLEQFRADQLAQIETVFDRISQARDEHLTLREQFAGKADLKAFQQEQLQKINEILDAMDRERRANEERFASRDELDGLKQASSEKLREVEVRIETERLNSREVVRETYADVMKRIERDRDEMQMLIDGLIERCQHTQGQLETLAMTHASDQDDLRQVTVDQAEDIAKLVEQLESQRDRTQEALDQISNEWRRTQQSIEALDAKTADASTVEALERKQAADASSIFDALQEQRVEIESLVGKVAGRLDAMRDENADQINQLMKRIDEEKTANRKDVEAMNQRWSKLNGDLETLAAKSLPSETFHAAERTITHDVSRIDERLDTVTQTYQRCLHTIIDKVQQMSGRIQHLETLERPQPVQMEFKPEFARELADLAENVKAQREQFTAMLEQSRDVAVQLNAARDDAERTIRQWTQSAGEIEAQSESLKASANVAREIMQAMKRSNEAIDAKLKSPRWERELERTETVTRRIADMVERAEGLYRKFENALSDMENARSDAAAREQRLNVLVDSAEKVLGNRSSQLKEIAQNAASLAQLIQSEAQAEERERPTGGSQADRLERMNWTTLRTHKVQAS